MTTGGIAADISSRRRLPLSANRFNLGSSRQMSKSMPEHSAWMPH
jgi:hypothetical protein